MKLQNIEQADKLRKRLADFYRIKNLIAEEQVVRRYMYAVTIYGYEPQLHMDKSVLLQVLQVQINEIETQLEALGVVLPSGPPLQGVK